MPYNTTAIPPRKEATGQTQLPLTRVRKIISVDPDVNICSNNAAFVITLATELFVQYLASESQNMVKLDRKPRRNIQYKDVSNAAARVDRLEFLQDTVPATVPFGKIKGDAAAAQARLRGATGAAKATKADRTSVGGAQSAPTAIASLTNGAAAAAAAAAAAEGAGGKKKQQQLPFTLLSGSHKFRAVPHGAAASVDDGTGVAAATALAHAAAAAGTADEAGPNDQLQQDMRRQQGSRQPGNGDVEMQDG